MMIGLVGSSSKRFSEILVLHIQKIMANLAIPVRSESKAGKEQWSRILSKVHYPWLGRKKGLSTGLLADGAFQVRDL